MVLAVINAEGCLKPEMAVPDSVKTPQPKSYVRFDQLPKEYDPYVLIFVFQSIVVTLMVVTMFLLLRINIFLSGVVLAGLSLLLLPFLIVFV